METFSSPATAAPSRRRRLREDSQCARILARLQLRPGVKIPMPDLVKVSGSFNIHSRVDELRKRGWTQIQNFTDVSVRPHESVYWLPKDNWQKPATPNN